MKQIYLIGSLKNENVPKIGIILREIGFRVFDDWFAPGPEADDFWRKFEKLRGSSYKQALNNPAAKHIFEFDKKHIDESDIGVLVMPCGKSGHLELGYMLGQGKKCFIYFPSEPDKDMRWDVMVQFATNVCFGFEELKKDLEEIK